MPRKNYCEVTLPGRWISAEDLDECLKQATGSLSQATQLTIFVKRGCQILLDAAIILLSYVNQVAQRECSVILDFKAGDEGVMGYLTRMNFFEQLLPDIACLPYRPQASSYYEGTNQSIVEFRPIRPASMDDKIPLDLSQSLGSTFEGLPIFRSLVRSSGNATARAIRYALEGATYTIFSELVGNVDEHSETELDGYAALQVYQQGKKVLVVVSDSGAGLLTRLKPTLKNPRLRRFSDFNLIVHMLNKGVSRIQDENGRGCGLPSVADHALKYNAELRIRLATESFTLVPADNSKKYRAFAYGSKDLPVIEGTHIAFSFALDNPKITG